MVEQLIAVRQNRSLVCHARAFGGGVPEIPFGLGAFQLIRRDLYAESGGHSMFPGHPMEDFMLARLVRRSGGVSSVAIGSEILSLRRYHGFADMRSRLVRSLRIQASDRLLPLASQMTIEAHLCLFPFLAAAAGLLHQLRLDRVHPALVLTSGLSLLTYFAGAHSARRAGAICRCRDAIAWLHSIGAVL
jgi:hypothetical protein